MALNNFLRMTLRPMPPYFYIKIEKKEQKEKKEKEGRFAIISHEEDMSRNLERGEVVAIGKAAGEHFPEVCVGDTLLIHHSVEGLSNKYNERFIFSDETHNYYVAAPFDHRGERNAVYGVLKGNEIIPNKEYIFLFQPESKTDVSLDNLASGFESSQSMAVTKSGLVVFENWEESRHSKEERAQALQAEVKQLAKSIGGDERREKRDSEITKAIFEKEQEAARITKSISQQKFAWLKVAFYNKELLKHFGNVPAIESTDEVVILSDAAKTTINVLDQTFIVAKHEYIALLDRRGHLAIGG